MKHFVYGFLWAITSAAAAAQSFKVLTYNVYAKPDLTEARYTFERLKLICQQLKSGPWDVVLIQEAWTAKGRQALSRCGFPHVMDLSQTGSTDKEGHLGSGLLILSRWPLLQQKRHVLTRPSGFKAIFQHGEALVRKSVYLAQIQLPASKFVWIANTHFVANYCSRPSFKDCSSYQEIRAKQLEQMAHYIFSIVKNDPVILGGDFNMGEHPVSRDVGWQQFPLRFAGFQQASHASDVQTSSGSNTFKDNDNGKIDHIFASPELTITEGALAFETPMKLRDGKLSHLSDHYGWQSTITLQE